jgi:excisionase family DNA binding protein
MRSAHSATKQSSTTPLPGQEIPGELTINDAIRVPSPTLERIEPHRDPKFGFSVVGLEGGTRVVRPEPETGTWDFWRLDGAPCTPEAAAGAIWSGGATISDPDAAERALGWLQEHARLRGAEQDRYRAPLTAQSAKWRADALAALDTRRVAALPSGEALLTPSEVCDLLRISARTLDRLQGQSLPAPVMIGGQRRFKLSALEALLKS